MKCTRYFEEIEHNLKKSINTEINLRETSAVLLLSSKPQNSSTICKNNATIRAGIGPLRNEMWNLETCNKKMLCLHNAQYKSLQHS